MEKIRQEDIGGLVAKIAGLELTEGELAALDAATALNGKAGAEVEGFQSSDRERSLVVYDDLSKQLRALKGFHLGG